MFPMHAPKPKAALSTNGPPRNHLVTRLSRDTLLVVRKSKPLNADGFEDVFVTAGMGSGFRYAINSVLLNDAGEKFYDAEFALGVEPRGGSRFEKEAFVLDCSGADENHPSARRRTGKAFLESLSSHSSAVFDLDNDGDLDIVTLDMDDRPQVLISDLTERRLIHFLKIKLVGTKSNRDGLGATVKVHLEGRTLTQYYDGKSGYFGQSLMPLYFGLGDASRVERIEVRWPSGEIQNLTRDLSINKELIIIEGAGDN